MLTDNIRQPSFHFRHLLYLYMMLSCLCLNACLSTLPELPTSEPLSGPTIEFLPFAEPFPIAPFPSDNATRYDADSITQLRLNFSTKDHTQVGRQIRGHLNELDGFALFAPISVAFDGQIDLATITSESVQLVALNESLEKIPLDLGDGFFPLNTPLGWFLGLPPQTFSPNLFFSGNNQIEQLRWRNESDRQAALLRYQWGDEAHLSHYEIETDTLIFRTLIPLKPQATYAVILTDALKGWSADGTYGSINSYLPAPMSVKDHERLEAYDTQLTQHLGQQNLAFSWTFTTGAPINMLDQVREGLYGRGSLAALEMNPNFSEIREMDIVVEDPTPRWHSRLLPAEYLERFSSIIATVTSNSGYAISFPDVDYFVFGSFESPNLRSHDEIWAVSPAQNATYTLKHLPTNHNVPFMLSVPKSSVKGEPPFPVVIYFHGTNSSRLEGLILAQELANQGIALLSFDQVGHGPIIRNYKTFNIDNPIYGNILEIIPTLIARLIAPHLVEQVQELDFGEGLDLLSQIGLFQELAVIGRWEDVNGDGYHSDAEGFFDPDPKRLCSSFWQDNVDAMALVKLLRNLSSRQIPPRIDRPQEADETRINAHMLSGDFNADGILDIGGPSVQISAAGTSLGGIHSLIFGAVETEIEVVTPIVPGAGMLDILARTGLRFLSRPLFESYLGQAVVGCPDQGREVDSSLPQKMMYISLGDDARRCESDNLADGSFASLEGDWKNSRVTLTNFRTGDTVSTSVDERGGFTLHLASDRGDLLEVVIYDPNHQDEPKWTHRFEARVDGHGRQQNTPDFRRSAHILTQILERCDPIVYASRYRPDTTTSPIKTLISVALGDEAVPINTSISLANALGLLGLTEEEWRPRLEELRDRAVLLGLPPDYAIDPESDPNAPLFDVDQLLQRDEETGKPPAGALGPFPAINVSDGLSAIRFADVEGNHEWIAGYNRDGFNYGQHTIRQIAAYHRCSGRVIIDEDPWCLQSEECSLTDQLYLRDACQLPE